jgi:hypothetical protein
MRVRVTLDRQAFRQLNSPRGQVGAAVNRGAAFVRDTAKREITAQGRVDTGKLRQSIESTRVRETPTSVVYEVGSRLAYAILQHEGTRGPIVPRRAKVLRFKPKGGSAFVFAHKVRGVTPSKFLTKALTRLKFSDFLP